MWSPLQVIGSSVCDLGSLPPAPGANSPNLEPGSKSSNGHVLGLTSVGTKSRPGQAYLAPEWGISRESGRIGPVPSPLTQWMTRTEGVSELSRRSSLLGSASHPESDILGPRERRVAHI